MSNENSSASVSNPVFVLANGQYFKVSVNKTTADEAAKGTYKPPTPTEVGLLTDGGGRRNKRKGTRRNKRKGTHHNKRKATRRNKRKGTRRNKRN